MRRTFLLILMLTCAMELGFAKNLLTGYEPAGLDELKKQKGVFKTTLIRPDADFSRYTEVQVRTAALVAREMGASNQFSTGRVLKNREKESVVPEFDEVVEFKRIVRDALAAEIEKSTDLEQVESAGPKTLILQPVITEAEITSSSRNKSEDGRELPEFEDGTVVFDLIDAETGLIQARLAERRRCKKPKGEESEKGVWPNLAYWAQGVAADLCLELQRIEVSSEQKS